LYTKAEMKLYIGVEGEGGWEFQKLWI